MGDSEATRRRPFDRDRLAARARRIIETEYASSEGCDTRAIAERLGVSRSRLCHSYRRAYGTTIGQDVRARRIRLARHLLDEEPRRLVKEVAAQVGYGKRSYRTFFNSFRQVVGISPREYQTRGSRGTRSGHARQSRSSSA